MRAGLLALAISALVAVVPPVAAQQAATVTGRVTDSTGAPLARVQVTSTRPARTATSDEDGRYRLDGLWPGQQTLTARRVGTRSSTVTVTVEPGAVRTVDFRLDVLAVALDTIVTEAEAIEETLEEAGFYRRQRMGFGEFVTRSELERMNAIDLWDVMRRIPFLEVVDRGGGRRYLFTAEGRCRPHIFVDGLTAIDLDGIPLSMVYGIEVYRRASQVPLEYSAAGRACAAVLVWTR